VLESLRRERFPAAQPGRCDGIDSDRTDGCCVRRCRNLNNNAGLCGPVVPLSTGSTYEPTGTALGSPCPTLPCCETLRLNPMFCCIETRWPAAAATLCQECGR
jgi:hypothetical protein